MALGEYRRGRLIDDAAALRPHHLLYVHEGFPATFILDGALTAAFSSERDP